MTAVLPRPPVSCLACTVAGRCYALPLEAVQEVLRLPRLQPGPGAGLLNLRGRAVPELAQALEHRLLETTARNAVAALGQWLDDPPRLAWGFLALFEDLVAPGAVYLLLPSTAGHVCRLLAGSALDPDQERRLLEPLAALPYLEGGAPPVERRPIAWQPEARPELAIRHYPLAAPACGAQGQWGMLVPRTIDRSHRNLFREASAELEKLLQVMATLQLLATANRKLTEADEAKNAFILTLNHDLRSPLGALQLGLDAMERGGTRGVLPGAVPGGCGIAAGEVRAGSFR